MAGQPGADGGGGVGARDVVMALAPFAALGSRSPQTTNSMLYFMKMMEDQAERERKLGQERAANRSTAELLTKYGYDGDPTIDASVQIAGANLRNSQEAAQRAQAKERRDEAERVRAQGVASEIADIRSQVGTELPEILQARMQRVAPHIGTSAEGNASYTKGMEDIRGSAKRLADARAAGAGLEQIKLLEAAGVGEPVISQMPGMGAPITMPGTSFPASEPDNTYGFNFGGPPPTLTTPGYSLGFSGSGEPLLPAEHLKVMPEGAAQMQRHIYETGDALTEKTAEQYARNFGLPLAQLSPEAYRKSIEPKAEYTSFQTNEKGETTPISVRTDPATGERKVIRHEAIPGVGRPTTPRTFDTTTETTTTTPRRPMDYDRTERLQGAMGGVIGALGGLPGFNDPAASHVDTAQGRVPKTTVIERAYKRRFDVDVKVQWDPEAKQFVIVQGWEPEGVRESTSVRRRGTAPPGAEPRGDQD